MLFILIRQTPTLVRIKASVYSQKINYIMMNQLGQIVKGSLEEIDQKEFRIATDHLPHGFTICTSRMLFKKIPGREVL